MASGREILALLDARLGESRRELDAIDREFQRANLELLRAQQRETEHYRSLARMRVDELAEPDLVEALDAADQRVQELLRLRETALEALEARVAANEARQRELESDRQGVIGREESAAEALDGQGAATQTRLAHDDVYQAQLAAARRAEETAHAALEKTEQALRDRVEKGRPYEADRLFMYLWSRGFETSRYRAWPLARYLDGRVARLVRFQQARPNYAMLLELPARLREHADARQEAAATEREALEALERAAAEEDGIGRLEAALRDVQDELERIDESLAKQEEAYQSLLAERSAFAAGRDEHFREALRVMAEGLRRKDMATLRERAFRTPAPEDDEVVAALAELEQERESLGESLDDQRQLFEAHRHRIAQLGEIRQRFKAEGFDGLFSEVRDRRMIERLLGEFLQGLLSHKLLWKAIRRRQRFRRPKADPFFGSGSLDDFGEVLGRIGRGGFGRGGGGFGGGGFGSGGGFGGGGFRSGGGF